MGHWQCEKKRYFRAVTAIRTIAYLQRTTSAMAAAFPARTAIVTGGSSGTCTWMGRDHDHRKIEALCHFSAFTRRYSRRCAGIGRAIALKLLAEGYIVLVSGREIGRLKTAFNGVPGGERLRCVPEPHVYGTGYRDARSRHLTMSPAAHCRVA